jgi:acetate kinase
MIVVIDPYASTLKVDVYRDSGELFSSDSLHADIADQGFGRNLDGFIALQIAGERISAVAMRVRWGGNAFGSVAKVDPDFMSRYRELTPASLSYHSMTIRLIDILRDLFESTEFYIFFETGFFGSLPAEAREYAAPAEFNPGNAIETRGLSGIFHSFGASVCGNGKTLSFVMDRQTSVCAIDKGCPLNVNPGGSPLEGIMGETTCGDLDPGIVFYLMREMNASIYKIDEILKKESGFYGITGLKMSIPRLFKFVGTRERVTLAFDVYMNHLLKYAGEGLALLEGLDNIIFSGPYVSDLIPLVHYLLTRIGFLDIRLKPFPWKREGKTTVISKPDSKVAVYLNHLSLSEIIALETIGMIDIGSKVLS